LEAIAEAFPLAVRRLPEVPMIDGVLPHQNAGRTAPELRELFERYCEFVKQLEDEGGGDGLLEGRACYHYEEFVEWWRTLDPDLQRLFARDFHRGYKDVIHEGELEVEAVLEKYRQPT
jgi:hypothetical protein